MEFSCQNQQLCIQDKLQRYNLNIAEESQLFSWVAQKFVFLMMIQVIFRSLSRNT